jgi:hypothetical protein
MTNVLKIRIVTIGVWATYSIIYLEPSRAPYLYVYRVDFHCFISVLGGVSYILIAVWKTF